VNVFEAAINAGSGGLLGLLGSVGNGVISLFQAKNQFRHDEAMADANLKLVQLQGDIASKVAENQFKTMLEQQAGEAFTASQTGANNPTVPWIDGAIKLWRPVLTSFLIGLTCYFYTEATPELRDFITRAVVSLTGMAVAWWWGNRQLEKFRPQ
jgi:hypothetical protein